MMDLVTNFPLFVYDAAETFFRPLAWHGTMVCGSDRIISEMVFDFTNERNKMISKKMRLPLLRRHKTKRRKTKRNQIASTKNNKTKAIYT